MTKWKYNSLRWIHKIREENYKKTKNDDLKESIKDRVKKVKRNKHKNTK